MRTTLPFFLVLILAGCSLFEDAATSIAYDIERGVRHLGSKEGSTRVITHHAQSRAGPEVRTIKVQFDKVGALIVWYSDENGKVVSSSSTSYLGRFVTIPETIILEKPIDDPVRIKVERRNGRAVVTRVY